MKPTRSVADRVAFVRLVKSRVFHISVGLAAEVVRYAFMNVSRLIPEDYGGLISLQSASAQGVRGRSGKN